MYKVMTMHLFAIVGTLMQAFFAEQVDRQQRLVAYWPTASCAWAATRLRRALCGRPLSKRLLSSARPTFPFLSQRSSFANPGAFNLPISVLASNPFSSSCIPRPVSRLQACDGSKHGAGQVCRDVAGLHGHGARGGAHPGGAPHPEALLQPALGGGWRRALRRAWLRLEREHGRYSYVSDCCMVWLGHKLWPLTILTCHSCKVRVSARYHDCERGGLYWTVATR